jgi:hypothetical protein
MNIDRVRLLISGGIAGLVRGAEVDAHDLATDERHALERHAGAPTRERAAQGRDLLNYELEIHAGQEVCRVSFDELTTPSDLAGLVQRLSARSRPVKP